MHAVDIYTGNYLWKAEIPLTPWVQTRYFDSRVYGRPTERNYVGAEDWVYAVTGDEIHAFDAVTGERKKVLQVPDTLQEEARSSIHAPRDEKYHGYRARIQGAPLWAEVRLWQDLLIAMLGPTLVAIDRHSGDVCWTRRSTRQSTTYALGGDILYGLDYDVPRMGGRDSRKRETGTLFALQPQTGKPAWQRQYDFNSVPKHEVDNPRLWLRPIVPVLSYNAKHRLLVVTVNRSTVHVLQAADGSPRWSKSGLSGRNLQRVYAPVVTDDYLLLSNYKDCYGYLLDIQTGGEVGENTGIPRPRTCARVIGNNSLLVYRDAATELYDIVGNRMIGLSSLRSGCTTSFVPAGGVMTAPMLGHGCVCNYPMFASVGLYHWPQIEEFRPVCVTKSWGNELAERSTASQEPGPFSGSGIAPSFAPGTGAGIDVSRFRLINATLEASKSGLRFSTKDQNVGYAVRQAEKPIVQAAFALAVKRAPGKGRHGNAFFVCGKGDDPRGWIECRLFYGGRSSIMIVGSQIKSAEEKIAFRKRDAIPMTVSVDCKAHTLTLDVAGQKLTSPIPAAIEAITHYGYGGSNSDNYVSVIEVR